MFVIIMKASVSEIPWCLTVAFAFMSIVFLICILLSFYNCEFINNKVLSRIFWDCMSLFSSTNCEWMFSQRRMSVMSIWRWASLPVKSVRIKPLWQVGLLMEVWPQSRALLMQYTRGGLLISEQRMMSVVSLSPMTPIKITVWMNDVFEWCFY